MKKLDKKLCKNCEKYKALTKTKKGYRFIKDHDLCNQCYQSLYSFEFLEKYERYVKNSQD